MRVRVLYFGMLKDLFGCVSEELELPAGALAETLIRRVAERAEPVARSMAIAVNREYARGSTSLQDGDEGALLPPVSGGCHAG